MQNVFVLGLEGYSRDLTKIRCGIRDLTATCEAGFPKVWAEGCGIGKEKYIRDSDDKFGMRDSGEKGAGNTGSVPPFQALFVQHFYSLI